MRILMNAAVEKLPRRWSSRLRRGIVRLLVIVIILAAGAPYGVGWIVGRTLQNQLSTRMRGTLQFKRVVYQFPYGVRIDDAHLSMLGTSQCSVEVGRLRLTLAKLPIGRGPLLVEGVEIENPTVRLAASAGNAQTDSIAPATSPLEKLSDLFRLKSVKLTGGRFEYDWSANGKSQPPMIWDHLDAVIHPEPADVATYRFSLSVDDKPWVIAKADGSVNIDSLLLNVDRMTVTAAYDSSQSAPLPPMALAVVQKLHIGGQLAIDGSVSVPLRMPQRALFSVNLALKNGRCKPPGFDQAIEPIAFSFSCSNGPDLLQLRVNTLHAECGLQNLTLAPGGELAFHPDDKSWAIRKLQGTGSVGDGPSPLLGPDVKLMVPFIAAGSGKWGDGAPAVRFGFDHAVVRLTPNPILVDRVNGMLSLTPGGLSSTGLTGDCADGRVKMVGSLIWDQPGPLAYHGRLNISKLDLHQLAVQLAQNPSVAKQAVGELDLNMKYWTARPVDDSQLPANWLRAGGDIDINHGYLLNIPVLKELLSAIHDPGASVLGEAASTFEIADQIVTFKRVAVSSPTLGIQGGGTLGFDQKLNMSFVATPLADWGKDIRNTGLPFVSHIARAAARLENLVNKTQSAVLYQFRVSGDLSKPEVKTVPVPILTDKMISIFERMSGDQSAGSMGDELKKQ